MLWRDERSEHQNNALLPYRKSSKGKTFHLEEEKATRWTPLSVATEPMGSYHVRYMR